MKSIDEFATDYAQDKYLPVQTYNAVMAGANYVLDEIEKMISCSDDELENHTKCKSAIFRLQSIIDELKSNQ